MGRRHRSPTILSVAVGMALTGGAALVVSGCGPDLPSGSALQDEATPSAVTSATATAAASGGRGSPSPLVVDPGAARLVWLVDRLGTMGVWTTDLLGGDVRTYLAGVDEDGVALRDVALAGNDIVLIRDGPTSDLWLIPAAGTPRLLLDKVAEFRLTAADEVLAARDDGKIRELWSVPLGGPPERIGVLAPAAVGGGELGPFGIAVSPDGRTIAAGWVGGPTVVIGPTPSRLVDVGAPLVVDDDGSLLAVTGRAGEAYTRSGGELEELAPPDSDPIALAGTGIVAWPRVGTDGMLDAVEVHDLIGGSRRVYPADGLATNVTELAEDHVLLEATAFDPLHRTVTYMALQDGRSVTFEADAPEAAFP